MRHEVTAIDLDRREVVARDLDGRRRGPRALRPPDVRHRRGAGDARRGRAPTPAACSACRPSTTARRCAPGWTREPAAAPGGGGRRRLHRRRDGRGADPARARGDPGRAGRRSRCPPWTATWASWSPRRCAGSASTSAPACTVDRAGGRGTAGSSAVVTAEGPMPADVVVLGLGVRPNTALAEAAGLPLGPTGGDPGRPADAGARACPGVWAAGDCVETLHRVSGHAGARAARHARQQAGPGRRASTSAAGTPPSPA